MGLDSLNINWFSKEIKMWNFQIILPKWAEYVCCLTFKALCYYWELSLITISTEGALHWWLINVLSAVQGTELVRTFLAASYKNTIKPSLNKLKFIASSWQKRHQDNSQNQRNNSRNQDLSAFALCLSLHFSSLFSFVPFKGRHTFSQVSGNIAASSTNLTSS